MTFFYFLHRSFVRKFSEKSWTITTLTVLEKLLCPLKRYFWVAQLWCKIATYFVNFLIFRIIRGKTIVNISNFLDPNFSFRLTFPNFMVKVGECVKRFFPMSVFALKGTRKSARSWLLLFNGISGPVKNGSFFFAKQKIWIFLNLEQKKTEKQIVLTNGEGMCFPNFRG